MTLYTTLLILLAWIACSNANSIPTVSKVLYVSNGGPWGDWGTTLYCPIGSYAMGFRMLVEPYQFGGDDTALNKIWLKCLFPDKPESLYITPAGTNWGEWSHLAECGNGTYLKSFALKVEPPQGSGDDTTANAIKFTCGSLDSSFTYLLEIPQTGSITWGTYGGFSESCGQGDAVCGIQTKVEGDQGSFSDDTALNDVRLYCC